MDSYTKQTQTWLDARFQVCDAEGYYVAHQPIYGFRVGPSEPGVVERYLITYQIIHALERISFQSLLDVGGAEGYKAALVRELYHAEVRNSDISREAVRRSQDFFQVEGDVIDIHRLPYADNAFDVVLCSETLEHVPNYEVAARELFRVARNAVVITVPHESESEVRRNIESKEPHGHIQALHPNSFDFLLELGAQIEVQKMISGWLKIPRALAEGRKRPPPKDSRYPAWLVSAHNQLVPVLRNVFGERVVSRLIELDSWLCRRGSTYRGMCFTIIKNASAQNSIARGRRFRPEDVLRFRVERKKI